MIEFQFCLKNNETFTNFQQGLLYISTEIMQDLLDVGGIFTPILVYMMFFNRSYQKTLLL